ncbi:MAG: IMP cyclohydrolase [Clostridia bacterium]|nr:IMP cyclohydrolase [Clostridia bacterium]
MELVNIANELKENTYPGRGIVIGKSEDGKSAVIGYFIMGRSENSRNRVFVADGDGIKTKAFDESKLVDPSLIIYSPVLKPDENITIVTNGDQTDTVYDFIKDGKTFEDALDTREFEPDAPNFTPRISGIIYNDFDKVDFTYKMSILKSSNGNPEGCQRFYFNYVPFSGEGHFIHTYDHDGDPIPSFTGEPTRVGIKGDIDEFTKELWENLNSDNKVSLFTRFIDLKTGKYESRIVNKNN